jgi:alpha-ketoglutarate-dependent taurine dioxygenase
MSTYQGSFKKQWPVDLTQHGWLAAQTDKDSLSLDLGATHLAALRELVGRTAKQSYPTITHEQFRHAALDPLLNEAVERTKGGKGITFLRGIPVDEFGQDELRRLYWGIGTYFGRALSQSRVGDMMGDVTPRPGASRGYTSQKELGLHTDYAEIISLLCLQPAQYGGENVFVSSLALWDIVERERPDFMEIMKRGFRLWRINEHTNSEPITTFRVPVFSEKNGLRSVHQGWEIAVPTAEYLGEPLSSQELAAIDFIKEVLQRPQLRLAARLEKGEAVFFSNYEVFHSRKAFQQWDDPAKSRHLLRLWLQSAPARALADEMYVWKNKSGLLGYDPDAALANEQYTKQEMDPISVFMRNYFKSFYTDDGERQNARA